MDSAPAVTYPVGRSVFHAGLLGLTGLIGALAGASWWRQTATPSWRHWLFMASWSLTGWIALAVWRRTPSGNLHWDGHEWSLNQVLRGPVTVHLDLQSCLLACMQAGNGGRYWLWLERRRDVANWHALRRALFSSGSSDRGSVAGVSA